MAGPPDKWLADTQRDPVSSSDDKTPARPMFQWSFLQNQLVPSRDAQAIVDPAMADADFAAAQK
jgi:hypothetical protein